MEGLKRRWHYYLAALLFVLGIFFLGRAYAYENPHAIEEIHRFYYSKALRLEDCYTFQQKAAFHKENGDRCLEEVKDRCWWLPNMTQRKNAQYCLTNAGALCYPGSSKSKMIAVLINSLVQYGLDCCDEWAFIDNKLYWAQYHYEMYEFYKGI